MVTNMTNHQYTPKDVETIADVLRDYQYNQTYGNDYTIEDCDHFPCEDLSIDN
jgi:hypothetical protein